MEQHFVAWDVYTKKKDVYPSEMLLQSWRLFFVLSIIPISPNEIISLSFN